MKPEKMAEFKTENEKTTNREAPEQLAKRAFEKFTFCVKTKPSGMGMMTIKKTADDTSPVTKYVECPRGVDECTITKVGEAYPVLEITTCFANKFVKVTDAKTSKVTCEPL
jgi:hypothetical protein